MDGSSRVAALTAGAVTLAAVGLVAWARRSRVSVRAKLVNDVALPLCGMPAPSSAAALQLADGTAGAGTSDGGDGAALMAAGDGSVASTGVDAAQGTEVAVTTLPMLRRLQRIYVLCPGSLGQWCGYGLTYADGRQPAMITLELPYDPVLARPEELPADHLATLHERWGRDAEGYLRAARPAVEKMLAAACAF